MNGFFATRYLIATGIFIVLCNVILVVAALFVNPTDDIEEDEDDY